MRLSQFYTAMLESDEITIVTFVERMEELRQSLWLDIEEIDTKLLEAYEKINELENEDYAK